MFQRRLSIILQYEYIEPSLWCYQKPWKCFMYYCCVHQLLQNTKQKRKTMKKVIKHTRWRFCHIHIVHTNLVHGNSNMDSAGGRRTNTFYMFKTATDACIVCYPSNNYSKISWNRNGFYSNNWIHHSVWLTK